MMAKILAVLILALVAYGLHAISGVDATQLMHTIVELAHTAVR
jgi:hypothetical protein